MRSSRRRSSALVPLTIASALLTACAWHDGELAVHVIPDPAGHRATSLLDAADTALAHGKPRIAQAAMLTAYDQETRSPEVAYRLARMADRLDDVGTAARAYRRYLSLAPHTPTADTARARLLALVTGPMRAQVVASLPPQVVESSGEVEPGPARKPSAAVPKTKRSAAPEIAP